MAWYDIICLLVFVIVYEMLLTFIYSIIQHIGTRKAKKILSSRNMKFMREEMSDFDMNVSTWENDYYKNLPYLDPFEKFYVPITEVSKLEKMASEAEENIYKTYTEIGMDRGIFRN